MFQCRSSTRVLSWIPFALAALVSCQSSPQRLDPPDLKDDFGDALEHQPITAETVGEREMLHRRWQLDLKGQAVFPTGFFQSNNFEIGPSFGFKAAIETEKDLFIGIDFDWARIEQKDGIGGVSPSQLGSAEPDQLFDHFDRYNVLLSANYDLTIAKSFMVDKHPLKWRFGVGIGGTLIDGTVDSDLKDQFSASGQTIKLQPYAGFCARFGTGLRWYLTESTILFSEVSYDFVYPFTMEVVINRDRSEVDGDIDFGAVNLGLGVAFEF